MLLIRTTRVLKLEVCNLYDLDNCKIIKAICLWKKAKPGTWQKGLVAVIFIDLSAWAFELSKARSSNAESSPVIHQDLKARHKFYYLAVERFCFEVFLSSCKYDRLEKMLVYLVLIHCLLCRYYWVRIASSVLQSPKGQSELLSGQLQGQCLSMKIISRGTSEI